MTFLIHEVSPGNFRWALQNNNTVVAISPRNYKTHKECEAEALIVRELFGCESFSREVAKSTVVDEKK